MLTRDHRRCRDADRRHQGDSGWRTCRSDGVGDSSPRPCVLHRDARRADALDGVEASLLDWRRARPRRPANRRCKHLRAGELHAHATEGSWGSICQGMPRGRTKTMPVRHARSGTRGRPPFGRRGGLGRNGSTRSHNASGSSAAAIQRYLNVTAEELRRGLEVSWNNKKADRFDSPREREMLNRYEEERSARRLALCVVPYLSHGTFASLQIWLRGSATDCIWNSSGRSRWRWLNASYKAIP